MIEKIALAIDQDFILEPKEIEVGTGFMIPTFFGRREVMKKEINYVPDYEKTNIAFAELISKTIIEKAKELGEITKIELTPVPHDKYRLIITSMSEKIEKEIDVSQHYGEEI